MAEVRPLIDLGMSGCDGAAEVAPISNLGMASRGIWTRRAALEATTPGTVRALLADGSWQSPLPGVYADGGQVLDADQWAFVAVLASGGEGQLAGPDAAHLRAVAAGRTAARVHRLALIDDHDPATGAAEAYRHDVAVWRHAAMRPSRDGHMLVRHQFRLSEGDVVQRADGLVATSLERTLADCAALLRPDAFVCMLDDVLHAGRITPEALLRLAQTRKGRAGGPALAAAVARSDARVESPHETLTRLVLLPGLPGLRPQVQVRDERGRVVARFDLADEQLRLAVESDGRAGHAGAAMVAKDRRRDAVTDRLGWTTERVTWWEVRRQPEQVQQRVLEVARRLALRP